MKTYQVDKNGYYGEFGGAYVPEILHQCVENLQNTYLQVLESDSFKEEFDQLLRDYVGRPSPLYLAKRLSEKYGCKIYLKREDLNHTGAHKINNTIGQILLARRMGKTRIIAGDRGGLGTRCLEVIGGEVTVLYQCLDFFQPASLVLLEHLH